MENRARRRGRQQKVGHRRIAVARVGNAGVGAVECEIAFGVTHLGDIPIGPQPFASKLLLVLADGLGDVAVVSRT